MLSIIRAAVIITAALVIAGAASAESGGVTATRQPVSADFTIPDICTFPIRVEVAGWMITTQTGVVVNNVYTLSNESHTRSLTQQNVSILRSGDGGAVSAQISVEKIVLPGFGLVYGSMGRMVFYFDDQGNFLGSEFHGRQDPYSQYQAAVCGYLS